MRWTAAAAIVLVFSLVLSMRATAPSDLHEGDQPKQADYVMDIVCRNHWLLQHHANGTVMSKPPLYNWIAAPLVTVFGAEEFWLRAPSILAGLLAALIVADMTRRRLGERAAFLSAIFLLVTPIYAKQLYFARTDMMLTAFIVMQLWAILRWEETNDAPAGWRSKWIWLFWGAAAFGNMAKGPIALLPHLVLSAWWIWEGRWRRQYGRLGVLWGVPFCLTPLAIWFLCAWHLEGKAVIDHLFYEEVVDRFRSDAAKSYENRSVFYYALPMLGQTLPWSLLALAMIWHARTDNLSERRPMYRFLLCWWVAIFLCFSLVPSKRVDRIFPAVPAICIFAGWAVSSFEFEAAQSVRAIQGVIYTIFGVFFVAGAGLCLISAGILKSVLNVRAQIEAENHREMLAVGGAMLMLLSSSLRFKPRVWTGVALSVCVFCGLMLHEFVFCEWGPRSIPPAMTAFCRKVRARAQAEHVPILLAAHEPTGLRFYLLQAQNSIETSELAAAIDAVPGSCCVVGTMPFERKGQHNPGSLETAGLTTNSSRRSIREWIQCEAKTPGGEPIAAVFLEPK